MPTCRCGRECLEGELFCSMCGAKLYGTYRAQETASIRLCRRCGRECGPDEKTCACGIKIDDDAQSSSDERAGQAQDAGSPPVAAAEEKQDVKGLTGRLKLVVEQGMVLGKQFLLSEPSMLVGRIDLIDQVYPDIDLTGMDEGYIHRRHAEILVNDEAMKVFVRDLGGSNRTYVNNRPISPNTPVEVKAGDRIRFGRVGMRLKSI